jgi:MoaA/NifB/PqqE/SkfB family radical SAM enzyme
MAGMEKNFGYTETNLSLEDFKKIFSLESLKKIKTLQVNGNFGDLVMNHQTPDILEYIKSVNPVMDLSGNTNGSAQTPRFWKRLGQLGMKMIFGIDGLKGVSEIHRQDTNFDRVIANAKIFMSAGGQAVWKIIEFDHNRHQIPEVKQLAKELGFSHVIVVGDGGRDTGPVYDRKGKRIFVIREDLGWPEQLTESILQQSIDNEKSSILDDPKYGIVCDSVVNKSVYVSADGYVYPCCWTGTSPLTYRPPSSYYRWNTQLEKFIVGNHGPTVGLESAVAWFESLSKSWNTDQTPGVCGFMCGNKK